MIHFRPSPRGIPQHDSYSTRSQTLEHTRHQGPFEIPRKPVPKRPTDHSQDAGEHNDGQAEALLQKYRTPSEAQVEDKDSARASENEQRTDLVVTGWPGEPKRLGKKEPLKRAGMVWDVILTLVPIVFVVFAFCAASLDQTPQSPFGQKVVEGLNFVPSLFPIVYAAIAGRTMRAIAQWTAERGIRLGLLEQLVGSQSVFSSIERLVMLKRYGLSSVVIVLLWLISPLGGQSSLRIVGFRPSSEQSQGSINYFDVGYAIQSDFGAGDINTAAAMSGIIQASLLAAPEVQRSPVDMWNNVKIPMVDELSPWSPEDPHNPWITVSPNSSDTTYVALTGLILVGVRNIGTSEFNLETNYMQLQCADAKPFTNPGLHYEYAFPYGLRVHNISKPFTTTFSQPNSFIFDTDSVARNGNETDIFSQSNILYAIRDFTGRYNVILVNCTIKTRHVEANVICKGLACAVNKIRRSTISGTGNTNLTPFFSWTSFANMCAFLGSSTGYPHSGEAAPLDYYVRGSDTPFALPTTTPNLIDASTTAVAKRLSVLLNTAWQVALAPLSISQGFAAPWTLNSSEIMTSRAGVARKYLANTTTAAFSREVTPRYITDKMFLAIFIIASVLLQACAVIGLVFKLLSISPDILGYVSTQTRDNVLFADLLPGEGGAGSTLDGLERSRLLAHWKVQIGDIRPKDATTGHIAFFKREDIDDDAGLTEKGSSSTEARVKKGRYYD